MKKHKRSEIFDAHDGGKIGIEPSAVINNADELAKVYTPGVADVCMEIHKNPASVYDWTMKRNTVAVVTDGSAVLGLGDIGPEAAMPVMEGKAMLFKQLGNIDAFPICVATQDVDQIVRLIQNISPGLGGINLEDIAAPRCFDIEARLEEKLSIPVFHDDQHGTAIVATAALINALKLTNKSADSIKVVISGTGAAGTACAKMLKAIGVPHIIGCDRRGALHKNRTGLSPEKQWFADETNPEQKEGSLKEVLAGADVFLGVSSGNLLNENDIKSMNSDAIVFAMANPTPEVAPEIANKHAAIVATGRSDYPNQINNVLCFPGIFRGALDSRSRTINDAMKLAAAYAIAECIPDEQLSPDHIIPSVFDTNVVPRVAEAVSQAAKDSGVCKSS